MYSKRKHIIYLFIPFFIFISSLLLIEGLVRFYVPYLPAIEYFLKTSDHHRNSEGGQKLFEGDSLLGWRLKAGVKNIWWDYTLVTTNNDHLREHRDYKAKKEGVFRIVCLGDSVTFGYRIPVVFPNDEALLIFPKLGLAENSLDVVSFFFPDLEVAQMQMRNGELPYPKLLKQKLKTAYPQKEIEVITYAVPGYSSYQGLLWLERDIKKMDADLIITSFGWNDADFSFREDKETLNKNKIAVYAKKIISKSQALMHLSQLLDKYFSHKKVEHLPKNINRVSSHDYLMNMKKMAALAEKNNSKILIIGQVFQNKIDFPERVKVITENRTNLKKMCKEEGISYLEIPALTEDGHPENRYLFGETIHPSFQGHQLMADEIFSVVRRTF